MNDETEKKRQKLDVQAIEDFFISNEISMECPICKTSGWLIPTNQSIGGNAIPWGTGSGDMFMSGLPVVVMICAKCKFVRQHALEHIPGSLQEN